MSDKADEITRLQDCRNGKERDRLLAGFIEFYKERLRLMVELRLDRRLRGRISPSDGGGQLQF